MADRFEQYDFEAQGMKDIEVPFTMNFKKIFLYVDEVSKRTMEVNEKHPKDSLTKLWVGTLLAMFVCFLLSYLVLIFITIPFLVFYFICLVRISKCWKEFGYSPKFYWGVSILSLLGMIALALLFQRLCLNF